MVPATFQFHAVIGCKSITNPSFTTLARAQRTLSIYYPSYHIMLRGILHQAQSQNSRDESTRDRSFFDKQSASSRHVDNERLAVRNVHAKSSIARFHHNEVSQSTHGNVASIARKHKLAPPSRSNHKRPGRRRQVETTASYRPTSETVTSTKRPEIHVPSYEASFPRLRADDVLSDDSTLFFSQQSWDAIHKAAQIQDNLNSHSRNHHHGLYESSIQSKSQLWTI